VAPTTGPSSGGQTVTIVGEHLANASVEVSLPNAHEGDAGGFGSRAQLTENTDDQVKFTTPEAEVGEGLVDVRVKTAGGEVDLKEVYEYKGALVPTIPLVVTGEATSITQTSAVLNATVNPRGLTVNSCGFTYGIGETEGEEGEEEKHAPCSPLTFTGDSAEPVSATLTGLTPNTTYGYTVSADNETGLHGGFGGGSERTFKTLGTGEVGAEEKAKEPAKEPVSTAPATSPVGTTPLTPTPFPITPPAHVPTGTISQVVIVSLKVAQKTKATVVFKADGGTAKAFQCALVKLPAPKKNRPASTPHPHYAKCESPTTYKHLKAAKYEFFVRAEGAPGSFSSAVSKKFSIT
jgi:IPT/TIG domain